MGIIDDLNDSWRDAKEEGASRWKGYVQNAQEFANKKASESRKLEEDLMSNETARNARIATGIASSEPGLGRSASKAFESVRHWANKNKIKAPGYSQFGHKTHEAFNRAADDTLVKEMGIKSYDELQKRDLSRDEMVSRAKRKFEKQSSLYEKLAENSDLQDYGGLKNVSRAEDRAYLRNMAGKRTKEYREWARRDHHFSKMPAGEREAMMEMGLSESEKQFLESRGDRVPPGAKPFDKRTPKPNSISFNPKNPNGLSYNPSKLRGYDIGDDAYWTTTKGEWLSRGFGSMVNAKAFGTEMLNSMGVFTKKQRLGIKASGSTLAKSMTLAMPLISGYAFYSMVDEGMSPAEAAWDTFVAFPAATMGYRVGKSLSIGLTTPAGKTTEQLAARKMSEGMLAKGGRFLGHTVLSGIGTAALTYAAVSSISDIPGQLMDSNSMTRRAARNFIPTTTGSRVDNEETMTHRQRALIKLSKSGLNDRSMLMGNEAAILAGVY